MIWYKYLKVEVREAKVHDFKDIWKLISICYPAEEGTITMADLKELIKVQRGLSLVAELNGIVAGYVYLSQKVFLKNDIKVNALWMEPLCVHTQFQKRGIGTELVLRSLENSKLYGYTSVLTGGCFGFFGKFGFKTAPQYKAVTSHANFDRNLLRIDLANLNLEDKQERLLSK